MYKIVFFSLLNLFLLSACFFSAKEDTGTPVGESFTRDGKTYSGTTVTGTWNPEIIQTGANMQASSGTTVTVSTNGPAIRPMTPSEQKAFQDSLKK